MKFITGNKIIAWSSKQKYFPAIFLLICTLSIVSFSFIHNAEPKHSFEIGKEHFMLDGNPFQIRCGELHFARIPKEYWRHRIQMMKSLGMNTICVYLFWNFHERTPGVFKWDGQADAAEFCKIAMEEGVHTVILASQCRNCDAVL